jgi:hypothetical protein
VTDQGRRPAGYSGTPLPKKLGIKPEHLVALLDAPSDIETTLGELPEGVALRRDLRGRRPFDEILLFVVQAVRLRGRFTDAMARLAVDGGLWVAWPKVASGRETDLSGAEVRSFGLSTGLVDNKICAIDDTWSGLRFVVRLDDRATWPVGRAA